METLELSVFIIVAIIAGAALILVLTSVDFTEIWGSYADHYKDREASQYSIGIDSLAEEVVQRWKECRLGLDDRNFSVYVKDDATITREQLVAELQRIDSCEEIDCKNNTGKLIVMQNIQAPKIIYIKCYNESLIIG